MGSEAPRGTGAGVDQGGDGPRWPLGDPLPVCSRAQRLRVASGSEGAES